MTSPSEEHPTDESSLREGVPSANQHKAEDFPPSPSQGDQETPGEQHPQKP
jgi:hypothetical protein